MRACTRLPQTYFSAGGFYRGCGSSGVLRFSRYKRLSTWVSNTSATAPCIRGNFYPTHLTEPAAVSIFKMKKDQSGLKQHSASKCVMQDTKMVNSGGKAFGHLLHLWYTVLY